MTNLNDCQGIPSDPVVLVNLDASDALSQAPKSCGSSDPIPAPNPDLTAYLSTIYGCTIEMENQQYTLPLQYGSAFYDFRMEDYATALGKFEALAAIPNSVRDGASSMCRQYIDVARVMADVLSNPFSANPNSNGWIDESMQDVDESFSLSIAPNPASQQVNIQIPDGRYQLMVYNLLGQLQLGKAISQSNMLDVKEWQSGIYLIKVIDLTTNEWQQEKLVVQK